MVTATRTASCGCTCCRAVVMEMRTNENGYTFMQTFSRAPDASVTTYTECNDWYTVVAVSHRADANKQISILRLRVEGENR